MLFLAMKFWTSLFGYINLKLMFSTTKYSQTNKSTLKLPWINPKQFSWVICSILHLHLFQFGSNLYLEQDTRVKSIGIEKWAIKPIKPQLNSVFYPWFYLRFYRILLRIIVMNFWLIIKILGFSLEFNHYFSCCFPHSA